MNNHRQLPLVRLLRRIWRWRDTWKGGKKGKKKGTLMESKKKKRIFPSTDSFCNLALSCFPACAPGRRVKEKGKGSSCRKKREGKERGRKPQLPLSSEVLKKGTGGGGGEEGVSGQKFCSSERGGREGRREVG